MTHALRVMTFSFGLVLTYGCGSNTGGTPSSQNQKSMVGSTCTTANDCGPSEFCTDLGTRWVPYSYCSKSCSADAECANSYTSADWVCGIVQDGSRGCVFNNCGEQYRGVACINGVSTACKAVDDTHCDQCGCPDTQYCGAAGKCIDKVGVGQPCASSDYCQSSNCGSNSLCRVALGSPCTNDNCDLCLGNPSTGWSGCSDYCTDTSICIGEASCSELTYDRVRYCLLPCVPGCECYASNGQSFCKVY